MGEEKKPQYYELLTSVKLQIAQRVFTVLIKGANAAQVKQASHAQPKGRVPSPAASKGPSLGGCTATHQKAPATDSSPAIQL